MLSLKLLNPFSKNNKSKLKIRIGKLTTHGVTWWKLDEPFKYIPYSDIVAQCVHKDAMEPPLDGHQHEVSVLWKCPSYGGARLIEV